MKETFAISGMHCASCAARIEKGVGEAAGVSAATVNFAAEELTVEYDPAVTGPAAIADLVKEMGFSVGAADRSGEYRSQRNWFIASLLLSLPVMLTMQLHDRPLVGWMNLLLDSANTWKRGPGGRRANR